MLYIIYGLIFLSLFVLAGEITSLLKKKVRGRDVLRRLINRVALLNKNLRVVSFRENTEIKIRHANYDFSTDTFLAVKELLAVSFFLLSVLALGSIGLAVFMFSAVGFFLPDIWLKEKVGKREKSMLKEMPYFLDLLTLCVEAGMDFGAAINRILEKSKSSALMEELGIMQNEVRIGKSREDALRNLSARLDINEISSFSSVLIQSDRMGISLGETLRVQSEKIRRDRLVRAEKAAHEAPVKMLFPLIIFIFPVVFIVIMGPIVLQLLVP